MLSWLGMVLLQRLQNREVQNLSFEYADTNIVSEGLIDLTSPESLDVDVDKRLKRYREIFAALLATWADITIRYLTIAQPGNSGSQLQRLEGLEQLAWERRTRREDESTPQEKQEFVDQSNREIDGAERAMKMA